MSSADMDDTSWSKYGKKHTDYYYSSGYPGPHSGEAVAIGHSAAANFYESIAIGSQATTQYLQCTAIGHGAVAGEYKKGETYNNLGLAVGYKAKALGRHSTAVGNSANASHTSSVAIGDNAIATHDYSAAIGYNAKTYANNTITLGTKDTTVYIPGNLVVGRYASLGLEDKYMTRIRLGDAYGDSSTYDYNLTGLAGEAGSGSKYHGSFIYHDWDFNAGRPDYGPGKNENELKQFLTDWSDRRLKNVGKVFEGGLEQIKKLQVFNYTFKDDKAKTPRVGVIAQDLQKIFPNAVTEGENGFLRIRWEDMFYAMVNAIKELDNKIFNIDKRVQVLEKQNKEIIEQNNNIMKENKELKARLDKLEKKIEKLK